MKNMKRAFAVFAITMSGSYAAADSLGTIMAIESLSGHISGIHASSDNPEPGACDWAKARSACTNMTDSFAFQGCSIAKGKIILLGGFDEAFSGTSADSCKLPLENGETVTHTSKGISATFASGESLAIDTLAGKAYDGTEIPATGIVSTKANDMISAAVNGVHSVFKDHEGTVKEESFALTTAPIQMAGKHGDGSFAINEGAVRVFHQLDKYTSDVTIEKLAWSDKACCHPVSGKLSEVMSGSQTGTRSLVFTATCGNATYTGTDGTAKDISLPACK